MYTDSAPTTRRLRFAPTAHFFQGAVISLTGERRANGKLTSLSRGHTKNRELTSVSEICSANVWRHVGEDVKQRNRDYMRAVGFANSAGPATHRACERAREIGDSPPAFGSGPYCVGCRTEHTSPGLGSAAISVSHCLVPDLREAGGWPRLPGRAPSVSDRRSHPYPAAVEGKRPTATFTAHERDRLGPATHFVPAEGRPLSRSKCSATERTAEREGRFGTRSIKSTRDISVHLVFFFICPASARMH